MIWLAFTIAMKSKNLAKNSYFLEYWVPIKRYDTQQCFDTRFNYIYLLALNDKAEDGSIQINQKASMEPQIKVCIVQVQIYHKWHCENHLYQSSWHCPLKEQALGQKNTKT